MFKGALRALGILESPTDHAVFIPTAATESEKQEVRAHQRIHNPNLLGTDDADDRMNISNPVQDFGARPYRQGLTKANRRPSWVLDDAESRLGFYYADHRLLHWLPIVRLNTTFATLVKEPGKLCIMSSPVELPTDHRYTMLDAKVIYVRNLGLPYTIEWHIEDMGLPIVAIPNDEYATDFRCQTNHFIDGFKIDGGSLVLASFMANEFTREGAWLGVTEVIQPNGDADILVPRQNRYCGVMRCTVAWLLHKAAMPTELARRYDPFYWKVGKEWFVKAINYITDKLVRPALPLGHKLQLCASLGRMDGKPTWIDGVPSTFDSEQPIDVLVQLHVTFMSVK
jgi:hypothetical protein